MTSETTTAPATSMASSSLTSVPATSFFSAFGNGVWAVWLREFTVFKREKARVISSLISPLMWIFFLGGGIGGAIDETALPPGVTSYGQFIYPGVIVMSIIFSSLFFGFYIIWDRKIDVLRAVLVAPVPRTSIFFGKVLGGTTDVLLQSTLLMVLGIFLVGLSPLAVPVGLLVAFFAAVSMLSLGLAIGSLFQSTEGFQVLVTFLAFPMFFLSGALYPVDKAPDWLKIISYLDPATYAVDAMRWSLLGTGTFPLLVDLGAMAGFTTAMVLFGTWAFSRMK